jgi:toxin FitB
MIIVDTNVLSELMRPAPSPTVRSWASAQPAGEVFTTAITVAEVGYGLHRLPSGLRKDRLQAAASEIFTAFRGQVLPFDLQAAGHYASIVSYRESIGLPIEGFDGQIAAICRCHNATLATRNTSDFAETGVDLLNPWQPQSGDLSELM